jgi:PPK2 family polyphosphate:nucleotide phosphotransferase
MKISKLTRHYRIDHPAKFRLQDYDPADTRGLDVEKDEAKAMLADTVARLSDLQEKLYAQDRWSVLVVFQAMDAAGKDGVIKHVMSGINPQGCQVHAFKQPSAEELDHDFLWRIGKALPERGRIGIFNRSHYEEVLVVRAHPEYLERQHLPKECVGKKLWEHRYESIRHFERHLARNGTLVLKFFLNVSKEEQRKRFLARLDEPAKRWKFSMGDVAERKLWDTYMGAYEDMIRATSREKAPWYVVPADNKWFTRLAVAAAIVEAMDQLELAFPQFKGPGGAELADVRKALLAEEARGVSPSKKASDGKKVEPARGRKPGKKVPAKPTKTASDA